MNSRNSSKVIKKPERDEPDEPDERDEPDEPDERDERDEPRPEQEPEPEQELYGRKIDEPRLEQEKYRYISSVQTPEESILRNTQIDNLTDTKIHICIYRIIDQCFIEGEPLDKEFDFPRMPIYNESYPFVEYILTNDTPEAAFPSFEYPTEDRQEVDWNDFTKQLYMKLNSMFVAGNKNEIGITTITKYYKGYYEVENNLYVFFDFTNEPQNIGAGSYKWALINEIIYIYKLYPDLFKTDEIRNIYQVLDIEDTVPDLKYKRPFRLYLCKKNEQGNYINVAKGEPVMPIEHETYGMGYCFSTEPIENMTETDIQQCVCFIVNCYYVIEMDITGISDQVGGDGDASDDTNNDTGDEKQDVEPVEPIEPTKIMEDLTEEQTKILSSSSIYFQMDGIPFYIIKNVLHFYVKDK
jgi:hypothetical protein